jgi:cytochrome c peroxidase
VGKFKAPTLRNVAVTAPYMHDGGIATLEGVLDHYAAGGRAHNNLNPDHPNKDPLIGGFELSEQDKTNLIAFLETLTDDAVLHDARYGNPWPSHQPRP